MRHFLVEKKTFDRTHLRLVMLVLLGSCAVSASLAQGPSHILGSKETTVVPEQFLRSFDPITVFFPNPQGPAAGGPLDDPAGLIRIEPNQPGEYRWVDSRTLQFLPTIAWPAPSAYTVTVSGKQHRLLTLMVPPDGTVPAAGSENLDPISELTLMFKQPCEVENLTKMVSFEVRPLPGLGDEVIWLTSRDFTIKALERNNLNDKTLYLIQLNQPIPFGKLIRLHFKLSLENGSPESFAQVRFSTKPFFRVSGLGTGATILPISEAGGIFGKDQALDGGHEKAQITVNFSDTPEALSLEQAKAMVSFEPAVKDLAHELNGGSLVLSFSAQRDLSYKVSLHYLPLKDRAGRVLEPFGPTSAYVYFQKAPSYLNWRGDQGLVERFGPQEFPMEGRDIDRLDMRVYKIDPRDPKFWPFQAQTIDEETPPPGPGEEPTSIVNMPAHIRLLGSPLSSQVVSLKQLSDGKHQQFGYDFKPTFAKISGKDQPGTYLVGYRVLGERTRHYVRIQVSDLSLSVFEEFDGVTFVVTSLASGQPVAGAQVLLENKTDDALEELFRGTTDANGLCHLTHQNPMKPLYRMTISSGSDVLVLNPEVFPAVFFGENNSRSWRNWLSWLQNEPQSSHNPNVTGFLYSERPVYRPEEKVHLRGYLREQLDGLLSAPPDANYVLEIRSVGDKVWTYPLTLDEFGNFYQAFDEKDLPSGAYWASVNSGNGELCATTFTKEAYRIPRFEAKLSGPDKTPLDQPFKLTLVASYYAGGRVAGQDVDWRITTRPYQWTAPLWKDFLFSSDERFSGPAGPADAESGNRKDVTDENGTAVLTLDPTTSKDSQPRIYTVEATVRGADEQTVSTNHTVLALPPFVLGLKLPRLLKEQQELRPEVIALGMDGEPIEGQEIVARVYHREWHSYLVESDFTTGKAKYVTDVVDKLISTENLVSSKEALAPVFPVAEAGVYLVELASKDALGRLQTVKADLFVSGKEPIAWQKPKEKLFEAVWSKKSYDPGEEASLIIKSPFQRGRALVLVEGVDANHYYWQDITDGQGIFKLKATPEMAPKLPVHVLLMRGRIASDPEAKLDLGKPISMAATTWLEVEPKAFQAKVSLEHERQVLPGSDMTILVKLEDPDGNPLNGEVTLWLVDRAVLALGVERSLDPIPAFVQDHPTLVCLRDTRNDVLGELPEEAFPGGDGSASAFGMMGEETVRKNFMTVPFYQAGIPVVNGRAEVHFKMADNLTDFAIRAVATSGVMRFGFAKSMVSVRLPVIVQPALPRFVRPGDNFLAGGIGRVVDGKEGPSTVEIQTEGLSLEGSATMELGLLKNVAHPLYFPLTVTQQASDNPEEQARITVRMALRRTEDGAGDAFELKLPVKPDRDREYTQEFIQLSKADQALPEPSEAPRPGTLTREVLLTQEPAAVKMLAALDYLQAYPFGCAEQRISQLMPQLAMSELMQRIGHKHDGAQTQLAIVNTLAYLRLTLTDKGLIAYWPGSQGYVGLTAYAVEFMVLAREAGYTVDEKLYNRAIKTLQEALRSDYAQLLPNQEYTERALALAALSKAGLFDKTYALELAARGRNMNLASEANMLNVLLSEQVTDPRLIDGMVDDLTKSVKIVLQDGVEAYGGLQYRGASFDGLTHTSPNHTLARISQALYRKDASESRSRLLVDALIQKGAKNGWGDTYANVAALLTLKDVLNLKPNAGSQFRLSLDGKETLLDTNKDLVTRVSSEAVGAGTLSYVSGEKLPLAVLKMSYLPSGSGSEVASLNKGFVIQRELELYRPGSSVPLKEEVKTAATIAVEMGTVVEEHLTMVNPDDCTFVAVRVPFAAGFEPMNPNLATSSQDAVPQGQITLEPSYAQYEDDQVTFFYDALPKGTYHFYFRLKASFAGQYTHPAARAELMYQQEVFGRGVGSKIQILPRAEEP